MQAPSRAIDFFVVSALALLSLLPSSVFAFFSPIALDVIWFLLPACYLIARKKKNIREIIIATILIGLLAFCLDIFLVHNHAWEPYATNFSIRVFGVPVEEMLWFFFHIFYILVWYEHFLDGNDISRISRKYGTLILIGASACVLALAAVYLFPDASRIRYAYAVAGTIAMAPVLFVLLVKNAAFLKKLIPLAVFFFLFAFVMEIRAVQFGLWSFGDTRNYLGPVSFFGATFPIEEIIFWMLLGPNAAIAYYEFFIDDGE